MPVTRAASRKLQEQRQGSIVPYQIPIEILGEVYRHVDHPAVFGAVNSAFRGVRNDKFFEKNRVRTMIEDEIRKNGGSKIFTVIPRNLATTPEHMVLFFDEGCVVLPRFLSTNYRKFKVTVGKGIRQVVFKTTFYINSLSAAVQNEPRFLPVGRFTLGTSRPENINDDFTYQLDEWFMEKLLQNSPILKQDLIRAIRADLRDPPNADWRNIYVEILEELHTLEIGPGKTVLDVIVAIFFLMRFGVIPKKTEIVGDTLEVMLLCVVYYQWAPTAL